MRIMLNRLWRYQGHRFLMPGLYHVPRDMSPQLAERAIVEGAAEKLPEPKPSKPQGAPAGVGTGRRGRRKGPAPDNKSLATVPETKAGDDHDN